jgi:hypothetical protein
MDDQYGLRTITAGNSTHDNALLGTAMQVWRHQTRNG